MNRSRRLLLLAFPRPWRERYGAELFALADDVGLNPHVALDMLLAGLRLRADQMASRARSEQGMVVGTASRHPIGFAWLAILLLAPTTAFVTGSLIAYQLGVAPVRAVMDVAGAWLDATPPLSAALMVSPPLAFVVAMLPGLRLDVRRVEGGPDLRIAVRTGAANMAVAGVALGVTAILAWHAVGEAAVVNAR